MEEIRLSKDNRLYIINGVEYSRVSDISSSGNKPWLEKWKQKVGLQEAERISRETAEYGELVHEITMWSDLGKHKKVDKMLDEHENLLIPLLSWQEWVEEYISKWILIEKVVYSVKLKCAGRVDRVGYFKGDNSPVIADLKTGALNDEIGIQLYGGYRLSFNEMIDRIVKGDMSLCQHLFGNSRITKTTLKKVNRCVAVSLPRKVLGELKVKEYSDKGYEKEFKSRAKLFQAMRG